MAKILRANNRSLTIKCHSCDFLQQTDAFDLSSNAKSYAGIARREGRSPSAARKLPERQPRSPRKMSDVGKPLKTGPWECGIYDIPSGVVRGECRGGLGGATAPNRPPSAARRAGGPNKNNGKAFVPAGHTFCLSKGRPCFTFSEASTAKVRPRAPRQRHQRRNPMRIFHGIF